jgi:hypothetical protein
LIIRELSKKERVQIIYLRTDWAEDLVEELWKCNHGQAPPLRLLCEIGIVEAAWLNYTSYSMEDEQQDWRANIPSWLGVPGDRLGGKKSIERLDCFGWVWEPESINEVTVATKDDEARIDVSIWAVVGKGERMEKSRELLRSLFCRWWLRSLTLKASHWLATYGQNEYEVNHSAIHECIVRACGSTWWDWPQGSRLFFW